MHHDQCGLKEYFCFVYNISCLHGRCKYFPELRTLFGFMKQIFILLFPHQQKCPVQIQCSVPPLGIGIAERFLAFCPADENGYYGNAGEGCVISLGESPGEETGHGSGGDGGGHGGTGLPG